LSNERRSDGPRLALEANAVIKLDLTGSSLNSRIVNASQKGMLVVMPDARPVGTRIRVTVQVEEPRSDITVAGIIVHATPFESVDVRFSARIGIFLTETGQDWLDLCDRLARTSPKKRS
jgi:tRNA pseudouridine-54 N-methylase